MVTTALNRITRRLAGNMWLPAFVSIGMTASIIVPLLVTLLGNCPIDGATGC